MSCVHCALPEEGHGRRYATFPGWHEYEKSGRGDQLVKQREAARRTMLAEESLAAYWASLLPPSVDIEGDEI